MIRNLFRQRLQRFHVLVEVILREPSTTRSANTTDSQEYDPVGYFQNLGVTATDPTALRALIEADLNRGVVNWQKTRTARLADDRLQSLLHGQAPSDEAAFAKATAGIWFRGGRIFY
jgi:hypothetical protein